MTWYTILNGQAFRDWLVNVGTASQIRQGQRLDPFVTSMRVTKTISERLAHIDQHQNYTAGDTNQAIADLAGAGLALRQAGGVTLTELGRSVLLRWQQLGIDNDDDQDELPRCLVLAQKGHDLNLPLYMDMLKFWREIRQVYDATSLLSSPTALYLVSYLNQSRSGFNPWSLIRASNPAGVTESVIDWDDLKAGTAGLTPAVVGAIDNIQRRIQDASTRATGRVNFCRAMELVSLPAAAARTVLAEWNLSARTKDRCVAALPPGTTVSEDVSDEAGELLALLSERYNVILYGPPGTGKTYHAFAVAAAWEERNGAGSVFRVTFHPSFGYEDFVQGYRPHEDNPGTFYKQDGALLRACDAAIRLAANADGQGRALKVLIVIDEINRGDVSRIFGELITYIEPDKRNSPVFLAQSPRTPFYIPDNVYFLGTMNTADKSISLLDVALRRRFAFVEFPPDPTYFMRAGGWAQSVEGIELGALLDGLNDRLRAQGIETDRAIGHALLQISDRAERPVEALRKRFEYDIFPLIVEYCYTDRTRIRQILGDLTDENGRLKPAELLPDEAFLEAVRSLGGARIEPTASAGLDRSSPGQGAAVEEPSDGPDASGDGADDPDVGE